MSVIESLNHRGVGSPIQNSVSARSLRQSWLKTLEQSGLNDALQMTKRFQEEKGKASLPDTLDANVNSGHSLRNGQPATAENKPIIAQQSVETNAGEIYLGSPVSFQRIERPLGGTVSVNMPMILLEETDSDVAKNLTEAESSVLKAGENLSPVEKQWQSQKVTLLQNGDGVEIWVRDTRLSPSGLMELLAGFRNSMSRLGISLVQVSLNGKPVSMLNQEKLRDHQYFGNKEQ